MLRIIRSKGKLYYKDLDSITTIEEIRKQSPIGIVIKVISVSETWGDRYKAAIGELLPVESIGLRDNDTYFKVKEGHKWQGEWYGDYVTEV